MLHSVCGEVTGITQEMLADGEHFVDTALDFLEWCGQDYIFCTWGSTDLVELQRNLNHYAIEAEFPMPFLFYDVQKLYSLCFLNGKERPALQTASNSVALRKRSSITWHCLMHGIRHSL